jgi:hypothetical protein
LLLVAGSNYFAVLVVSSPKYLQSEQRLSDKFTSQVGKAGVSKAIPSIEENCKIRKVNSLRKQLAISLLPLPT